MKPNTEQQSVIESRANKILTIAGPGSGKTATLVARIGRIIADGQDPSEIVVITYTNAAAKEIQDRLLKSPPVVERDLPLKLRYVGTIHGFLLRLLSAQHKLVGLPATLSVIDDDQKQGLLETIRAEMSSKASVKSILPMLKRTDLMVASAGLNRTKEELVAVEYHARLRQSGLLDFDSILYYGERLIRALDGWSYKYLFVDEVQDSADEDFRIYEAMPCENKFFVGDDSQAIYGFRGGNVQNMLRLAQESPANGWTVFTLEKNYRSGHLICGAANRLILNNSNRFHKSTNAVREGGEVEIKKCGVVANELGFVLDEIQAGDLPPGEIAVLARTNKLASRFAEFLQSLGVPVACRKYSENPVDWKKARLFLTVLANRWNDLAVYQFVTEESGKEFADRARTEAAKRMCALYEVALPQMKGADGRSPVAELGIAGISAESRERIHDAARTLSADGEWTINELLIYLNNGEIQRQEVGEGVFVGTMHSAKGREWRTVFLVGCEQGTIPSGRKDTDIEEERRLFYVGLTRAKERLCLTYCENRPKPFAHVMEPKQASQFIAESL